MSGMDDPREILNAAGVECSEVDRYYAVAVDDAPLAPHETRTDIQEDAILALARLVASQAKELKKSETFIALLKGMVEQLEGDKFEGYGYDLDDLFKRIDEAHEGGTK